MAAGREDALVRGLLTGIAAFRWLAWAWMAFVLLVSRDELDGGRPWLAVGLVGAALVVTAVDGVLVRTDPDRLLTTAVIVAELAVGFALGAGDDWAFAGDHPQSLGSVWPLAGVLTAGVKWGGRGGAIAGAVVGLGRLFGDLVEVRNTEPIGDLTVTASSTFVLYALAGGVAGYAAVKLREAEREISMVQAREEVARTLHDGVLQTLAVVQRRASDPDLVRLARDQERELREYLFGAGAARRRARPAAAAGGGALRGPLRRPRPGGGGRRPAQAVRRSGGGAGRCRVEALTNAGKHGGARR